MSARFAFTQLSFVLKLDGVQLGTSIKVYDKDKNEIATGAVYGTEEVELVLWLLRICNADT